MSDTSNDKHDHVVCITVEVRDLADTKRTVLLRSEMLNPTSEGLHNVAFEIERTVPQQLAYLDQQTTER